VLYDLGLNIKLIGSHRKNGQSLLIMNVCNNASAVINLNILKIRYWRRKFNGS